MATMLATLLLGCAPPVEHVTASVHDDPVNVATIEFTSASDLPAHVEYGPTADYGFSTPVDAGGVDHTIDVIGLLADTRYHYRVVLEDGDEDLSGEDHTFTTQPLPADLPLPTVEGTDRTGGNAIFTVQQAGAEMWAAAYALDGAGNVVWYDTVDGLVLGAHTSRDGRALNIQVSHPSQGDADGSAILTVPFNGGETTEIAVPFAHHDFVEMEDGSFVSIVSVIEDRDGEAVQGDALVRVDRDGNSEEIWNAFDTLPLEENEGWDLQPIDWTHANGMDWDPVHHLFAVSLFRQKQVLLIDEDGAVLNTLGVDGDFTFVDDPGFGPQHGPKFTEGGMQLFDNAGDGVSRVVEYAIDAETQTLTPRWELSHPWGAQVVVMGDAVRTPSGQVVSAWGEKGDLLTTSADGQVSRRVLMGGTIGRLSWREDLYPTE